MIKNKNMLGISILIGLNISSGFSQQAQTASGGDASGGGGSVAYSIGQIACKTYTSTNGNVNQGVQQAYEIYSVGIKETELNYSMALFPNPTSENLILQISDYTKANLQYFVYDLQGKLLNNGEIKTSETLININSLPTATYFINVVNQENKKAQSFKIIKTK
jgi:hypothetical protein